MSSFYSGSLCQSMYDDGPESFFGKSSIFASRGKISAFKSDGDSLKESSSRMFVKTSLKITDFSLMRDLREAIPDEDATVPRLETLNTPLVDLNGSITATIEDLEKMNKLGAEGPLALLGGVPNVKVVEDHVDDPDFEHSSELRLLDENEASINIGEFLRKDALFCPQPPKIADIIPVTVFEQSVSPSSPYSASHFFNQTRDALLPTTVELTNGNSSSFVFGSLSPKKESAVFGFDSPSTSSLSLSGGGFFGSSPASMDGSNHSDDRYLRMRRKNNMASKRSRQTRREKELENEAKAKQLQRENERLKRKVEQLEEMTNNAKKYLMETVMKRR